MFDLILMSDIILVSFKKSWGTAFIYVIALVAKAIVLKSLSKRSS